MVTKVCCWLSAVRKELHGRPSRKHRRSRPTGSRSRGHPYRRAGAWPALTPVTAPKLLRPIAVADALERIESEHSDHASPRLATALAHIALGTRRLATAIAGVNGLVFGGQRGLCVGAGEPSVSNRRAVELSESQCKSAAWTSLASHKATTANNVTVCRTNILITCPPCLKGIDVLTLFFRIDGKGGKSENLARATHDFPDVAQPTQFAQTPAMCGRYPVFRAGLRSWAATRHGCQQSGFPLSGDGSSVGQAPRA